MDGREEAWNGRAPSKYPPVVGINAIVFCSTNRILNLLLCSSSLQPVMNPFYAVREIVPVSPARRSSTPDPPASLLFTTAAQTAIRDPSIERSPQNSRFIIGALSLRDKSHGVLAAHVLAHDISMYATTTGNALTRDDLCRQD